MGKLRSQENVFSDRHPLRSLLTVRLVNADACSWFLVSSCEVTPSLWVFPTKSSDIWKQVQVCSKSPTHRICISKNFKAPSVGILCYTAAVMRTLPSDLLPALILLRLSATDPSFSRDLKGRKCVRDTVNKICFFMSLDSQGSKMLQLEKFPELSCVGKKNCSFLPSSFFFFFFFCLSKN